MALRFRGRDIRPTVTGPRVNADIRAREVRVIDEDGEQLGVMPVPEAIQVAEDRDLDLVEVSPNSDPPVCKIMDFGRYKYTQQKKAQEAKKRQKVVELKEVKMRIKIEEHDYAIKKRHAERFLLDGNKAKVTIMFRGREVTHPDFGRRLLDRLANDLIEIATVEQASSLEGRNMTMILAPKPGRAVKGGSGRAAAPREARALKSPLAEAMEKAAGPGDDADSGEQREEGKKDAEA